MTKKYIITLEMDENFDFNEEIIMKILKLVPNEIIISLKEVKND
jgi:hypothetical protein